MIKKHHVYSLGISLGVFLIVGAAMAAGGEIRPDLSENVKKYLAIAAGFGMAIASIGGAMGQGRAVAAAVEGIARNPGAQNKIFIPMIVGLALIESLVLFSFLVASGLAGKI